MTRPLSGGFASVPYGRAAVITGLLFVLLLILSLVVWFNGLEFASADGRNIVGSILLAMSLLAAVLFAYWTYQTRPGQASCASMAHADVSNSFAYVLVAYTVVLGVLGALVLGLGANGQVFQMATTAEQQILGVILVSLAGLMVVALLSLATERPTESTPCPKADTLQDSLQMARQKVKQAQREYDAVQTSAAATPNDKLRAQQKLRKALQVEKDVSERLALEAKQMVQLDALAAQQSYEFGQAQNGFAGGSKRRR